MIKKVRKYCGALLMGIVLTVSSFSTVLAIAEPEIHAESAIIIEAGTGKVLYEKNPDERMYPASITKVLTALVLMDYIEMDEIIVAGTEVDQVPWDSSKAGHLNGESILGLNLVRALMLPSGNETGCVAAINVARRHTGNNNISYSEAEQVFAQLMNERARELGAVNTNFINPHGYHDDDHYTTARDLALICKAALENEVLSQVIRETRFTGNGAGESPSAQWKTQDYVWNTTNELMVSSSDYYYPAAVGIKTGFTTPAGRCLASAAEKDGKRIISVVLKSEDPYRWEDSIALLNYGFDNFKYITVQPLGDMLDEIILENPPIGFQDTMTVGAESEYIDLYSDEQAARIKRELIYEEDLYTISEEDGITKIFDLPIEKNQVMGKVVYTLDGEIVYEDNILAGAEVYARTIITDIQYYWNFFITKGFTLAAVPFWVGGIAIIVFIVSIIRKVRKRRERYSYTFAKKKRW